jgi:hypothetical protein
MKTKILLLLLACTVLCGCANQYVITLQNGRKVNAASKPRLQEGHYVYKDAKGQPVSVPAGRVREISPASMVKDRSGFTSGPGQK